MEITTKNLIEQTIHLLDQVDTNTPEVAATVTNIRTRLEALLHLCNVGHSQTARFGLSMLSPEIDQIILEAGIRDTVPPDTDPSP